MGKIAIVALMCFHYLCLASGPRINNVIALKSHVLSRVCEKCMKSSRLLLGLAYYRYRYTDKGLIADGETKCFIASPLCLLGCKITQNCHTFLHISCLSRLENSCWV